MATEKQSLLLAESLGDNCLTALTSGTTWEYRPESAEGADPWCLTDDDHDPVKFFQVWYVSGYYVESGRLFHVIHSVDVDGDWDACDSCDVDDPAYDAWSKEYDHKAQQASWTGYYRHAQKTGLDPLGVFLVKRTHKQSWTAKLVEHDDSVELDGIHQKSIGGYRQSIANQTNLIDLPAEVRDFLMLNGLKVAEFKSLNEIGDDCLDTVNRLPDGMIVTFTIDMPDDSETIKNRIRLAAEEALDELETV